MADIPATKEALAEVRAAITKIVLDNTGDCACIDAYKGRGLIDPLCMWHQCGVGIIEDTMAASVEPYPENEDSHG